jgi:RNA polymerase sigma factor (sigma-70 family)
MVLGLCRRILHNEHDAEDAFQATFLVLSQKAASLYPHDSLCGWLHCVAYRVAQEAMIAASRRHKHEGRTADKQVTDPLAQLTIREAQEVLDEELARLPDKFRLPLVLCGLEGMTRDEAAHQLGWQVNTLKSRLEQARERLRVRLTSRGLALSAALLASVFYQATASAAVPSLLLNSTVKAATVIAAGGVVASVVSTQVAALTEGVVNAMFVSKVKIVATMLLLAGAMSAGIWFLGNGGPASQGQEPKPSSQPAATKDASKEPKKGGPKGDAAVAAEQKALEGTWLVTGAEIEGRKATKEELADGKMVFVRSDPPDTVKVILEHSIVHEVVFKRDRVVMKADGRRPELKFVLYPDKTPKAFDIPFTAKTVTKPFGGGPAEEGTVELVRLGIYKVEGDRLTICLTDGGTHPRPKEFDTSGGTNNGRELYTFRREPAR